LSDSTPPGTLESISSQRYQLRSLLRRSLRDTPLRSRTGPRPCASSPSVGKPGAAPASPISRSPPPLWGVFEKPVQRALPAFQRPFLRSLRLACLPHEYPRLLAGRRSPEPLAVSEEPPDGDRVGIAVRLAQRFRLLQSVAPVRERNGSHVHHNAPSAPACPAQAVRVSRNAFSRARRLRRLRDFPAPPNPLILGLLGRKRRCCWGFRQHPELRGFSLNEQPRPMPPGFGDVPIERPNPSQTPTTNGIRDKIPYRCNSVCVRNLRTLASIPR